MADRLLAALNTLAFGVAFLDANGRVDAVNDTARRMLRDGCGMRSDGQTVVAIWPPDRARLEALVAGSSAWPPGRRPRPLLLHDEHGKPVVVVFAHALRANESTCQAGGGAAGAVFYVRALPEQKRLTAGALNSLFRATAAETALVAALYARASLTRAGVDRDRPGSTLRTLRATLEKACAKRQESLRTIDRVVGL